jgi:hypothetical protein
MLTSREVRMTFKRGKESRYDGGNPTPTFNFTICFENERPVRLTDKPWLKILFADLLWEKNTVEWLANLTDKLKWTWRDKIMTAQIDHHNNNNIYNDNLQANTSYK